MNRRANGNKATTASRVRSATVAHGMLGVAISAILYLVCLSGTISVFKDELEAFEQRADIPTVRTLSSDALMRAATQAMQRDPESAHLLIYPPTATRQSAVVSTDTFEYYIDDQGGRSVEKNHPWSSFLIDLHYYLNLPHNFGMLVVATFGVLLFAMSLSGLLAHPNIFKDAFSFRRGKSPRLLRTDLHNRLGVWTLPFHMSNSLTGAMIGLASISALAIASINYGDDTAAVYAPVFGAEPAADARVAPMSRIDLAMTHVATEFSFAQPVMLLLHDPLTQGQYLQIFAEHPDRLIFAEKYNYDGSGTFLGTVGSADGHLGQQVADSVYKVHFGSFGGLPLKLAYGVFGLCLLFIIHAGIQVYFLKRGAKPGLYGSWLGVALGAPALLLVSFCANLLIQIDQSQFERLFWLGLPLCMGVGYAMDLRKYKQPSAHLTSPPNTPELGHSLPRR